MIDFERLLGALRQSGVSFVIVGGVAATVHGSVRLTTDIDVVYDRSPENIAHLVSALSPMEPYLRGVPPGLPFRFDAETLRKGLNFTLTTTAGPIDLLGELAGVGDFRAVHDSSVEVPLFGSLYRCITLDALIASKRAAGRPKDLDVVAELETIREEARREPSSGE
jgi:hypothetical protein